MCVSTNHWLSPYCACLIINVDWQKETQYKYKANKEVVVGNNRLVYE